MHIVMREPHAIHLRDSRIAIDFKAASPANELPCSIQCHIKPLSKSRNEAESAWTNC
ncbi:hypothetical protein NB709_002284 [Xanthomonas sacchari]|nr:hypothetical protein [Xanthomonas sacchari]MCW0437918.1 hypothetical protein [Xanthomonas sacchari]